MYVDMVVFYSYMQSVSMLQNLRVKWKVKGPFLVVAPVSTLAHWQREIESLTDMNCVVYAGSMEDRTIMRDYEFYVSPQVDQFKFNVSNHCIVKLLLEERI